MHQLTVAHGAYPSPLNYRGFPKSVCTSVNNVACHGIPDDRPLQDGDIVNIDVTVSPPRGELCCWATGDVMTGYYRPHREMVLNVSLLMLV